MVQQPPRTTRHASEGRVPHRLADSLRRYASPEFYQQGCALMLYLSNTDSYGLRISSCREIIRLRPDTDTTVRCSVVIMYAHVLTPTYQSNTALYALELYYGMSVYSYV